MEETQTLTVQELEESARHWYSVAQREALGSVFSRVRDKLLLLQDSQPLAKLNPVMECENGVELLRVGGRLKASPHLPKEVRHLVILPNKHPVTSLIIAQEDQQCNHSAGSNHLLSNLSEFWIVRGKSAVKRHRNSCINCKKVWAKATHPVMGQLSSYRTSEPLQTFAKVDVDYGGPFYTKQGRGRPQLKRWVCVFTCLQVCACHLGMATSLDTNAFLMAFDRFIKRRGVPVEVVSDNGTNFTAAEKLLREAVIVLDGEKIKRLSCV